MLRVLAGQRSPDSYVAGGIAINRHGPRYSRDIDLFHDSAARLQEAVEADQTALAAAGYGVTWLPHPAAERREATIEKSGERMQLEWVTDSAFRFFPTVRDELFGYVLHPADLAANKAAAAADRRVPRDIVDLATVHDAVLKLGAVLAATVGKFPGVTPEELLAEITRHSRFTAEEFAALAVAHPVDMRDLHRRIRNMLEEAERFLASLPSDAVGVLFLDRTGTPVQPDLDALDTYTRHAGAPRGLWPSSPEIGRAMLERYGKR